MLQRFVPVCMVVLVLLAFAPPAHADVLSYVSDLISTSAPGSGASHQIQFTLIQAIPASGSFTITPADGAFTLPAGFGASDIVFSIATSGPYVAQTLASVPSATANGASAITGATSSVTITLDSAAGLAAGTAIQVVLASTTAPAYDPVNPTIIGSYHIRIKTDDASGGLIDYGTAMTAIIAPITTTLGVAQAPPVLFNGEPSGTVAANNPVIELSLTSNEPAYCRYATSTGIAYDSMTHTFSSTDNQEVFYTDLTGFQNDTSYAFYVRCKSTQGLVDTADYPITFTLAPTPISDTSVRHAGPGGIGPYIGGSKVLYLGTVTFNGATSPNATVTILENGVIAATARADASGTFTTTVSGLQRGMYSFGLYATDSQGRKTANDSQTLTVDQGSVNTITGILLSPSIALASSTVAIGSDASVVGQTIPSAQVQISVAGAGGSPASYTATSSATGAWSLAIPGSVLSEGSYTITARTIQSATSISDFSVPLTLNVGAVASPSGPSSCGSSTDLNGDGKVNLIDFSIFLTHWGTSGPEGDFNCDSKVNLADFSIMLFNWTG